MEQQRIRMKMIPTSDRTMGITKYLEERYDQLQLSHTVKRVIDDYIACLQTRTRDIQILLMQLG